MEIQLIRLFLRWMLLSGFAWILLFLLVLCLISMKHKFLILKHYILTRVYTQISLHHETCEEWVEIWNSALLYIWYLYRFEFIGQAQKSIKQFLYMVIEGTRSIWFGNIFPYMVMEGNESIPFCTVMNTIDVTVLLELVLYYSSITFNPTAFFVWKALHTYEALCMCKDFSCLNEEADDCDTIRWCHCHSAYINDGKVQRKVHMSPGSSFIHFWFLVLWLIPQLVHLGSHRPSDLATSVPLKGVGLSPYRKVFFICSSICVQAYLVHPELVHFGCLWLSQVTCHPASIRGKGPQPFGSRVAHAG